MMKDQIKNFENRMLLRVLKKNTILRFPEMPNKYVYLLKEGCIQIAVMNDDGKEVIKYLVKPGDFFGEIQLLGVPESDEDYAIALEDSVAYFADVGQMQQWMNTNLSLQLRYTILISVI